MARIDTARTDTSAFLALLLLYTSCVSYLDSVFTLVSCKDERNARGQCACSWLLLLRKVLVGTRDWVLCGAGVYKRLASSTGKGRVKGLMGMERDVYRRWWRCRPCLRATSLLWVGVQLDQRCVTDEMLANYYVGPSACYLQFSPSSIHNLASSSTYVLHDPIAYN